MDPNVRAADAAILIVSPNATIRQLVEQMLGAEGFRTTSAWADEHVEDALRRVRPAVVVLDCDHDPKSFGQIVARAREEGSEVVLFSPSRDSDFVRAAAARLRLPWFTLPISRDALARLLGDRRDDALHDRARLEGARREA